MVKHLELLLGPGELRLSGVPRQPGADSQELLRHMRLQALTRDIPVGMHAVRGNDKHAIDLPFQEEVASNVNHVFRFAEAHIPEDGVGLQRFGTLKHLKLMREVGRARDIMVHPR